MERNRERPVTTDDEIDRTERGEQVAPKPGLSAPGLDDDDAPKGGVDSAEFPGTAAP